MAIGRRVLFDTGVYILAIRGGLGSPAFHSLQAALPRAHLSSVVAAELRAGATSEPARRAVDQFTRWADRVGRVATPTAASWERAGDILGAIRRKEPHLRSKVPTLWNDVLIALSARQIGAEVVTANIGDFETLRRYLRFDLTQFSESGSA
jgi:predicted nucleic acid-binding protein